MSNPGATTHRWENTLWKCDARQSLRDWRRRGDPCSYIMAPYREPPHLLWRDVGGESRVLWRAPQASDSHMGPGEGYPYGTTERCSIATCCSVAWQCAGKHERTPGNVVPGCNAFAQEVNRQPHVPEGHTISDCPWL
jgi:hypothetical protein